MAALIWAFLPQPIAVDLGEVTRGPMQVTVDEDGKTQIRERYVVSAPLSGRLLRIDMEPGDAVQAGASLLATIEPKDPELLDARAVAEAEAQVQAAEASLEQIEPLLEQARATQAFVESELRRLRQAAERTSVSQSELAEAELAYRTQSEELREARLAKVIATFELELARAALLRSRPRDTPTDNNWNVNITSPIDGRVLRLFQESAAVVTPGTPLLELGDPIDLEVLVDVLSSDAVKILPGAEVRLEHWGGDVPLLGQVRLVEPSAFTKISTLGVEEQRVNVLIDLNDPPSARSELGDGFRVEARIVIWEGENVVQVPTSALFRVGGDWAVFVVNQGRAEQRSLEVQHQNDRSAEVVSGLDPGDQVILHASDAIRDGVQVVPR